PRFKHAREKPQKKAAPRRRAPRGEPMHISIFSQLYDKPHGCVVSAARKRTAAERCIENLSRNFAAIVSRRAQSVERKMRRIRGRRERRGRESSRGCSVHRPLSEIPPAVA